MALVGHWESLPEERVLHRGLQDWRGSSGRETGERPARR